MEIRQSVENQVKSLTQESKGMFLLHSAVAHPEEARLVPSYSFTIFLSILPGGFYLYLRDHSESKI